MNPTFLILPIILVVVACAAVTAGALAAANILRRREAEAGARRKAARQAERDRTVSQAEERLQTAVVRATWIDPSTGEPHRNDHICNQQCRDLKEAAKKDSMQTARIRPPARELAQAARSRYAARPVQKPAVHGDSGADLVNLLLMQQALNSISHDQDHEDRGERTESQEQPQERAAEAPANEPVPYSAPEPTYTAPEPMSYTAPDPAPSYDAPSFSDSGNVSGGGDF